MKTQIIALGTQEDYLSVGDKMSWSQTGRILLTWPTQSRILRHLDLVLIQRQSQARGAQLGFVTRNPQIRIEAEELGIPVFTSTRQAQVGRWRVYRRRRTIHPPPRDSAPNLVEMRSAVRPAMTTTGNHKYLHIGMFALGILALGLLLAYIIPMGRISLVPESQTQLLNLEVIANPDIDQPSLIGILPTYPISVIVEGRSSIPSTGKVLVPFKPAMGEIQFTNLTEYDVVVPKGSVVCTLDKQPVRFVITEEDKVPAGIGRSIKLPATAMIPGAEGNLPAGSLVAIEGNLGLQLSATNLTATHGGSHGQVDGPSEADRQALLAKLSEELRLSAMDEMQAILPPGDQALPPTLTFVRTLEEAYDPEVGLPASQLELTLRLEFSGLAVASTDLQMYAQACLDARLPDGFIALPNTLEINAITPPAINSHGEISWRIEVRRNLQAEIPPAAVIALVPGKTIAEASQQLWQSLPLAQTPVIEIKPAWWPRLPLATFRIQIAEESAQ